MATKKRDTGRGFQGDCFYGAAFNARVASQELGAGIWPLGREVREVRILAANRQGEMSVGNL